MLLLECPYLEANDDVGDNVITVVARQNCQI